MLHALTIFLSAFLLFMIQPLMGKLILPWFGGAPAVWTTCMLFFQFALLGGYTYAHLLASRLRPRRQAAVHIILLAGSVLLMALLFLRWGSPVIPGADWKPTGEEAPVPLILSLLLVSIGLPYLLLSATSPLLQRWYSLQGHGERTYRLYAVSNAGSLLGLLSYPFFTERFFTLPAQAAGWGVGFAAFAAGCILVAVRVPRDPRGMPRSRSPEDGGIEADRQDAGKPRLFTIATWVLLTLCTSALLLAVTNELCQEIASVPFLWVLPLALYLLSFIISFDRPGWYKRRLLIALTAFSTLLVLLTSHLGERLELPAHIVSFCAFLLLFCLTGHGELVRLKPGPRHLTFFYLFVSLGGALGGVVVGLLAPALFTGFWEFNIMVAVGWLVFALVLACDKESVFYTGERWYFYGVLWFFAYTIAKPTPMQWLLGLPVAGSITLLAAAGFAWFLRGRRWPASPLWPRLLVGAVIVIAGAGVADRIRSSSTPKSTTRLTSTVTLDADRNFFGALRVDLVAGVPGVRPPARRLQHGRINHGIQYLDNRYRRLPATYYGPESGAGLAVRFHPRQVALPPQPLRIGVLGLGAGTMAAFAKSGDTVRFYEINPTVIEYSAGPDPFFTYLRDCRGEVSVVLGDARLSLERELREGTPRKFDVLVMDAFSSDSVPVHLLTREAIALYEAHLRDEKSVIAIHISNKHLDFRDLMSSLALGAGFEFRLVDLDEWSLLHTPSRWALLTKNPALFERPELSERSREWQPRRTVLWTDSFSNLFQLME